MQRCIARRVSAQTALSMVARGVRASGVRIPQVHDRDKQGLATYMIALAHEKGIAAYVGVRLNRWPAVHRLDAALLYRLALEEGSAGAVYHAVAEEGVSVREPEAKYPQGMLRATRHDLLTDMLSSGIPRTAETSIATK